MDPNDSNIEFPFVTTNDDGEELTFLNKFRVEARCRCGNEGILAFLYVESQHHGPGLYMAQPLEQAVAIDVNIGDQQPDIHTMGLIPPRSS